MGQLLDLLLVDMREVLGVGVVELLNGLGQLGIDIDQLFQRFLKCEVLLV
jgi:hypothetical protein